MTEPITFYRTNEVPYGCFSNFSKHPVVLKGKEWPTSEHYYQAMKFEGTEHVEELRLIPTAREVAGAGRERDRPMRPDWDEVKELVMLEVLYAKFTQHEDLKAILLGTGDALIVEHSKNDSYWADGGDGSGLNRLGYCLMATRQQIVAEQERQTYLDGLPKRTFKERRPNFVTGYEDKEYIVKSLDEVYEIPFVKQWSETGGFYGWFQSRERLAKLGDKRPPMLMALYNWSDEYYGCLSWYVIGYLSNFSYEELMNLREWVGYKATHKATCWSRRYDEIRDELYGRPDDVQLRMVKELGWPNDDMFGVANQCSCGYPHLQGSMTRIELP